MLIFGLPSTTRGQNNRKDKYQSIRLPVEESPKKNLEARLAPFMIFFG
jgi:hypothetical protein